MLLEFKINKIYFFFCLLNSVTSFMSLCMNSYSVHELLNNNILNIWVVIKKKLMNNWSCLQCQQQSNSVCFDLWQFVYQDDYIELTHKNTVCNNVCIRKIKGLKPKFVESFFFLTFIYLKMFVYQKKKKKIFVCSVSHVAAKRGF